MPPDEPEEDDAPVDYNDPEVAALSTSQTYRWSERLLADGSPQPRYIVRNSEEFGFISPLREFIETIDQPKLARLSAKWGVGTNVLAMWKTNQNWDRQRLDFWNRVNQDQWRMSGQQLAEMRGAMLLRQGQDFKRQQELINSIFTRGSIFKGEVGKEREVALSVSDVSRLINSFLLAAQGERSALGLNVKVRQDVGFDEEDEKEKPVINMTFNVVRGNDGLTIKSLDQSADGDTVEGEIQG